MISFLSAPGSRAGLWHRVKETDIIGPKYFLHNIDSSTIAAIDFVAAMKVKVY